MERIHAAQYNAIRLSLAIRDGRAKLALTRPQLAQAMGYKKIDRGCQRIAQWERGCALESLDNPNGIDAQTHKRLVSQLPTSKHLEKLTTALELNLEMLENYREALLSTFALSHQRHRRIREFKKHTLRSEHSLIKRHHKLLLDHANSLKATDQFKEIQLSSCGVSASFLGAIDFTLGDLLTLSSNPLVSTCAQCGSDFWNLKVSGSTLSGRHTVTGFCTAESCDQSKQQLPKGLKFGRFARVCLKGEQSNHTRSSHWSLSQLIHHLGGSVPLIEIYSDQFEVFAHYDPSTWMLTFTSSANSVDLSSVFETQTLLFAASTLTREPEYESSSDKKHITIQSLQPLKFGAFVGNSLNVDLGGEGVWRYRDGVLADPNGVAMALMKMDPPPAVLFALARHLSGHHHMKEPTTT